MLRKFIAVIYKTDKIQKQIANSLEVTKEIKLRTWVKFVKSKSVGENEKFTRNLEDSIFTKNTL